MESSEHTRRARVLFDEAHSEAWSIRPEVAERMQAAHPADASLAAAAAALARRDFDVAANDSRRARRRRRSPTPTCSSSPIPPSPGGSRRPASASRASSDAEIDAIARLGRGRRRADRPRRDRAGQVRQQPQRAARPLRHRDRERDRPGLRAPPRRRAELDPRQPDPPPPAAAPTRSPASARPASTAPGRSRSSNGGRVLARTLASAVVARTRRSRRSTTPRRRPRRRARRLRPVRRRLHRRARPRGASGSTSSTRPPSRRSRPAARRSSPRPRPTRPGRALRDAVEELRVHAGAGRLGRPRRGRRRRGPPARARRDDQGVGRGARAALPAPGRLLRGARAATSRLGRRPASRKPDFMALDRGVPARAGAPRRDRAPRRLPDVQAERLAATRCFEALIVRVPWPRWVVELERRYDNAKFVPVEFVDYTAGYDSECAVLFPETFSVAERPPATSAAIFCDREAERFRRVGGARRRHPQAQPAARRRLPARARRSCRATPTSPGT